MALSPPRLAAPARLLLATAFALPLLPLLLWAVADRWSFPGVLPQDWGLSGWRLGLQAGALPAAGRSLLVACAVAAVATPLGAMAARALVLTRVPLAALVTLALLSPIVLPAFAVALGLDVLLIRSGLPSMLGVVVVLAVAAIPYTVFVMRTAYGAYDVAFEDEARTLGASARQVLLRVRLAVLAPALAASAFLAFLVGWSDYTVTLLLGGGRLVTLPLLVGSASASIGNEPVVAALSLSALLPPLALLLVVRRLGRGVRG